MTIGTKPRAALLAAALLVLCAVLAGTGWYLQPERAVRWGTTLALVGCMGLALGVTLRSPGEAARAPRAGELHTSAVVCAGGILAVSLCTRLATTLGVIDGGAAELSQRAAMVTVGAFLAFTGNALPKMLVPLSASACDVARMQAFQRLAGWTWVLTGLAYSVLWLALPVGVAKPASTLALGVGMLIVAVPTVSFSWRRASSRAAASVARRDS